MANKLSDNKLSTVGLLSSFIFLTLFWLTGVDSRSLPVLKPCQIPIDCDFPEYSGVKPEVSCLEGFCKCDSNNTMLATLALPVRMHFNRTQYYGGYHVSNVTVCAPHVGKSCGYTGYSLGYCAPGSYCSIPNMHIMYVSSGGSCKCNPHRSASPESGLCVCDAGYTEDETGECRYNLPDSCEADSDCGTEYQSYKLVCSNGKCACQDDKTVWGAGLPIPRTGEVTGIEHALKVEMCLPRAGRQCTELTYCAPRSVCSMDDESPSLRTCRCTSHSIYSNQTGLCECEPGYTEHKNSLCITQDSQPCNSTADCKLTYRSDSVVLSSPEKCIHGICVCDPSLSVKANISKTSIAPFLDLFSDTPLDPEDTICAIKPKKRCTSSQNTCSPGSYCKPSYLGGLHGVCQCRLDRVLSSTTGLCECRAGFKENDNGTCIFQVPVNCTVDSACGNDTISKSPRVCLNDTCACNPTNSVFASARVSDFHATTDNPQFRGFSSAATTQDFCAPKPGQPCAPPGLCSPGSYCVYAYTYSILSTNSGAGTCRCVPHSRLSEETGLCQCLPGYTLSSNGTCLGGMLFESCSDQSPCGLEPNSSLPLSCVNGTCQCDPDNSVHASARTSSPLAHSGNPEFRGYTIGDPAGVKLCAPKPGKNCVGRGFCSPNSYCVYRSQDSWAGVCRCNPNMVISNITGLCECPAYFDLDAKNNCRRRVPDSCVSDFDCGQHPVSKTSLICNNGRCQCDSTTSIGLQVKSSFVSILLDGSYIPRNGSNVPDSLLLCVLKPGQSCRGGEVCAPGSNCETRYSYYTSSKVCTCSADKVASQVTGLCECRQGSYQDDKGVCNIGVGGRCYSGSVSSSCGLDYGSKQRLNCVNNVCVCDSFSPTMVIQYTPPANANYESVGTKSSVNLTICVARPGGSCNGYCTPGSFCADQNFSPTSLNGTCVCNLGTFLTSRGTCEKVYQAPCDNIRLCSAGLFCIQGKCQCQLKSQTFNELNLTCISKAGGPCHEDDVCVEFSKCHQERCVCAPGFTNNSLGQCSVPHGGVCKETRECGPSSRFQCTLSNRCACSSSFHYSDTRNDCVSKEGSSCSTQPDSVDCVENAYCAPSGTGFKCACSPGFSAQNGACLAVPAVDTSKISLTTQVQHLANDAYLPASDSPTGTQALMYILSAFTTLVIISVVVVIYLWKKKTGGRRESRLRSPSTETEYDTLPEPESNF